jgi:hypothetical protein
VKGGAHREQGVMPAPAALMWIARVQQDLTPGALQRYGGRYINPVRMMALGVNRTHAAQTGAEQWPQGWRDGSVGLRVARDGRSPLPLQQVSSPGARLPGMSMGHTPAMGRLGHGTTASTITLDQRRR